MKNRRPGFLCGFTLVELVVAVAVIAVGMVFVLGAFNQCVGALSSSEKLIRGAGLLAREFWWEPGFTRAVAGLSNDEWIAEGEWSGLFTGPYDGYNWTLTVRPMSSSFGDPTDNVTESFYEGEYRISWRQGRATRSLASVAYIRRPPK